MSQETAIELWTCPYCGEGLTLDTKLGLGSDWLPQPLDGPDYCEHLAHYFGQITGQKYLEDDSEVWVHHELLAAAEDADYDSLSDDLCDIVCSIGPLSEAQDHEVERAQCEDDAEDDNGLPRPAWRFEGAVIFAENLAEFTARLSAVWERKQQELEENIRRVQDLKNQAMTP